MRRLCVVCEGHSEVEFCKHIIEPYIWNICEDAKTIPITIKTGFSKETGGDCKGGITSFVKAKKEIENAFLTYKNLHDYVTTMFDLFRLPADFPNREHAMKKTGAYEQVKELESALAKEFEGKNFIPYIQLHEFEALVFSDLDKLKEKFFDCDLSSLDECLRKAGNNPELINTNPDNAPSKRIEEATKGVYNKVSDGNTILSETGIDVLMSRCCHFKEWIEKIVMMMEM